MSRFARRSTPQKSLTVAWKTSGRVLESRPGWPGERLWSILRKEWCLPIVRGNCRKDGDRASERKRTGMTHDNKQDSGNAR